MREGLPSRDESGSPRVRVDGEPRVREGDKPRVPEEGEPRVQEEACVGAVGVAKAAGGLRAFQDRIAGCTYLVRHGLTELNIWRAPTLSRLNQWLH